MNETAIQQPKQLKILLLGDSCYDYYHYGTVTRISPEAPIPIFDLDRVEKKYGMASNVYENLKALGADVHIVTAFIENKRRFIDLKSGQQLLRVDEKINEEEYKNIEIPSLPDYDALVISDYDKGFISYETIEQIVNQYHGPIFIDTKKRDLARFQGCIVKINEYEYNKAISYCDSIIITYGSEKVTYGNHTFKPAKVDAYDVCGAGDTFLAALAYKYTIYGDMNKAIEFAMKAAAITVQHIGVYAPTLQEIEND